MQNTTTNTTTQSESAQINFLVTTCKKVSVPVEPEYAEYEEITAEEIPTVSADFYKPHFENEKHRTRLMPLSKYEMTYEQYGYILSLGSQLSMFDVVSRWCYSYRTREAAEKYISYLEERYSTSKQAA